MGKYNLSIVGGCGSSGTTLLAHLLSKHPDVVSGPEFNCFNHYEIYDFTLFKNKYESMFYGKCMPWGYIDIHVFMTYREQYGIDLENLANWVLESSSTDEFFERLCLHVCRRFEGSYFIEKSPTNVYSFQKLVDKQPNIPLVHLIRDGRDVAASLMKRGFNLYFAGTRWLYDTLCGLNGRGSASYYETTYEELVSSPDNVLNKIFQHLDIDPNKNNEQAQQQAKNTGVYQEDWLNRKEPRAWNQTPADPISSASVGKYKSALTEKELSALYRITLTQKARDNISTDIKTFGDLIEYLGYDRKENIDTNHKSTFNTTEKYLELQDYLRRLKRYRNNGRLLIPSRYSRIS
jgi:hypothetical protein